MIGTFTLSLDTELAWGTFDLGGLRRYGRHLARTRLQIDRLLSLLDQYEIAATWAFVGHLFLDRCERVAGHDPHPDVLVPNYSWYPEGWHRLDPGTDRKRDPFWYGDDIVKKVMAARTPHEIGCHTFSHIVVDDPAVTAEIVRSQLQKCRQLARKRGRVLRSFVFPRNAVAHLPVLREQGFICYRGLDTSWYRSATPPLLPILRYLDHFLAITPPTYGHLHQDRHGLVNLPASMFLTPPDGIRALIPGAARVRKAKKGLAQAAKSGTLFHLWFHPWNLGGSDRMLGWLERILHEAASLRAQGRLRTRTMGELAAEVIAATAEDATTRLERVDRQQG